jgi:hypothetical protein
MAKLIVSQFKDSQNYNYDFNLNILTWDGAAGGIDDALMQRLKMRGISVYEWFDSLRGKVKIEAHGFLKEVFQSEFSPSFSISD